MADNARAARLAKRIQTIVASAIEREVKDRRLELVTVTDTRVTGDLHDATVFYTVRGRDISDEPDYDAAAEALTERLPAGEVVVRTGALESGEVLMSVAFEISGKMTQPTGQVKISLPAEALNGCAIHLIDEDGTETPIELEIEEETASFTLDFTESQTPSRLLRLVPQA